MSLRGRKPIDPQLRKDNVVRFRLTGDMKDQLKVLADEKNLSVSVYLTKYVEARIRSRSKRVGA